MKQILICDDEYAIADELAEFFSRSGWHAVTVYEAARAMELLASADAFTCLLTDFAMPHLNGEKLIEFARALPIEQQPKVICMMTGAFAEGEGSLLGDVQAFQKPFDPVSMNGRILRLLEAE